MANMKRRGYRKPSQEMTDRRCSVCGKFLTTHQQKYCSVRCMKGANDTLCWECNNYYCSWLQSKVPVKGWEAIPTELEKRIKSYRVVKCPEYIDITKKEGDAS